MRTQQTRCRPTTSVHELKRWRYSAVRRYVTGSRPAILFILNAKHVLLFLMIDGWLFTQKWKCCYSLSCPKTCFKHVWLLSSVELDILKIVLTVFVHIMSQLGPKPNWIPLAVIVFLFIYLFSVCVCVPIQICMEARFCQKKKRKKI